MLARAHRALRDQSIAISSPQSRLASGMNTSLIALPLLSVAGLAAAKRAVEDALRRGERIGGRLRPRRGFEAGADRSIRDLVHGAADLGQSLECVEAEF